MNFFKKLFGSKEKQALDFPKAPNIPLPMKPLIDEKRRGLIGFEFGCYLSWVEDTTKKSIMGKELDRRIRLFLHAEKLDFNEGDVAFVSLVAIGADISHVQKTRKDGNLDWRWPKMEKHMGLKKISSLKFSTKFDGNLPRQFLQKAHSDSEQNAFLIQEQINLATGEKMEVTEYKSAEVAAAVIGTSLGLLSTGGSALMNSSQGKKVLQLCKKYNLKDTKASLKDAKAFQKGIDEYITGFKKSLAMKTSPFNKPAGILLMNFGRQKEINKVFMPDQPTMLNPVLHQIIMDQLALMIVEPLKIFKK